MEKKKVYVPVEVENELPINNQVVIDCGNGFFDAWYNANKFIVHVGKRELEIKPTHWLKEQELYTFSSDEFNVIARMIYDSCWNITRDGWNAEIWSFKDMGDKEKETYREQRNKILQSLGIK